MSDEQRANLKSDLRLQALRKDGSWRDNKIASLKADYDGKPDAVSWPEVAGLLAEIEADIESE